MRIEYMILINLMRPLDFKIHKIYKEINNKVYHLILWKNTKQLNIMKSNSRQIKDYFEK